MKTIPLRPEFRNAVTDAMLASRDGSWDRIDAAVIREGLEHCLADRDYFDALRRHWNGVLPRPLPDAPLLDERDVSGILAGGLDALSDREVVELAVQPHRLLALRDEVLDAFTPYWEEVAGRYLQEVAVAEGTSLMSAEDFLATTFGAERREVVYALGGDMPGEDVPRSEWIRTMHEVPLSAATIEPAAAAQRLREQSVEIEVSWNPVRNEVEVLFFPGFHLSQEGEIRGTWCDSAGAVLAAAQARGTLLKFGDFAAGDPRLLHFELEYRDKDGTIVRIELASSGRSNGA